MLEKLMYPDGNPTERQKIESVVELTYAVSPKWSLATMTQGALSRDCLGLPICSQERRRCTLETSLLARV
jgi:hypothetical protein